MSYILEAIRRSEEARHKRLIPAVSAIHAAPPPPPRTDDRTLQAALAMALALALVAATGWALGPWLRQVQEADPPAPVAATPAPVEPAPNLVETAPQAPTPPGAAAASTPGAKLAEEANRPRRPYSSAKPASDPAKPRREPRAAAVAPPADSIQPQAEVSAQPARTSELVTATPLRDLPQSVQRTLPSIAITLHLYATSTDARMIRVNGRMAREGDAVAGELSVAEITRSGVVFTIAGQRFYMDAFQTWPAKSGS